jgi:hypothetical protein
LSCFVQPGDHAASDLLAYLETPSASAAMTVNMLRFLERTRAKTEILRRSCISLMLPRIADGRYEARSVAAAVVLGRAFRGDGETLKLVAVPPPDTGSPLIVPLVAMCEGWPKSDPVDKVFQYVRSNNVPMPYLGYLVLVATKSSKDVLLRALRTLPKMAMEMRSWEISTAARFLVRRMKWDDDVYAEALDLLREEPLAASVGGMVMRLAAAARGLPLDVRALAAAWAERELSGATAPVLVVDPLTGRERALSHCVLDVR